MNNTPNITDDINLWKTWNKSVGEKLGLIGIQQNKWFFDNNSDVTGYFNGGLKTYYGSTTPYLLIISEYPWKSDLKTEEAFGDQVGNEFKGYLTGILKNVPVAYYYIFPFSFTGDNIPKSHLNIHITYFVERIRLLNPQFVLVLGKRAWDICSLYLLEKMIQWTESRK
jgi:uracil-DNA glycosylase